MAEHNFRVEVRWLSGGGDPARKFWWHVTEITLDHLRPSPQWEKEMNDLELAKAAETEMQKRLKRRANSETLAPTFDEILATFPPEQPF